MSLYLKVERFGSAPRLLRVRAFATAIGFDSHGVLCAGTPEDPHFTAFNTNGSFIICAEQAGVSVQGRPLAPGVQRGIAAGEQIQITDFTMTAYFTTESAEFFHNPDQHEPRWGRLEVTIAGLRQVMPLYNGSFTVGSAPDDTLPLPIAGILPRHIVGEIQGEILALSAPLGGAVVADNDTPLNEHHSTEDLNVQLAPIGITLHFVRDTQPKARCEPAEGITSQLCWA